LYLGSGGGFEKTIYYESLP